MIGIDEVGRGSWAGPLLVCAVELADPLEGLIDSKKLSKKNRETLADAIKTNAKQIELAWVSSYSIDRFGMAECMRLACKQLISSFSNPEEVIIDGNTDYVGIECSRSEIRAEDKYLEVAAASIVAKVARDNYMKRLSLEYPDYGFASNVGYGTKVHHQALLTQGLTPYHRRSFKPVRLIDEQQQDRQRS